MHFPDFDSFKREKLLQTFCFQCFAWLILSFLLNYASVVSGLPLPPLISCIPFLHPISAFPSFILFLTYISPPFLSSTPSPTAISLSITSPIFTSSILPSFLTSTSSVFPSIRMFGVHEAEISHHDSNVHTSPYPDGPVQRDRCPCLSRIFPSLYTRPDFLALFARIPESVQVVIATEQCYN